MATKSAGAAPTALIASTNELSETPASNTKARAGVSVASKVLEGVMVGAAGVATVVVPFVVTFCPLGVTIVFSVIFTVILPWLTAAGVTLTLPPITTVPRAGINNHFR